MSKLKDFSRYPQITTQAQPSFFGMYISVWLTELQSVCTLYFTAPFNIFYLDNLQCKETFRDHISVLMSLIFWDQFLLSCLLGNTVKVWSLVTIYLSDHLAKVFIFPCVTFISFFRCSRYGLPLKLLTWKLHTLTMKNMYSFFLNVLSSHFWS